MKKTKYIIICIFSLLAFTSCLKEYLPQTSGAIAGQIATADKKAFVNGILQFMNYPYPTNWESAGAYTAIGYPEFMLLHDVMTSSMPMRPTVYNYWTYYNYCDYMGDHATQTYYFRFYNKALYLATSIIKVCDKTKADDAFCLANGYAFRAYFNLEMTRMYEFKKTGTALDDEYYDKLRGLTIPIVNENTTEEMAGNNPRAPYYKMYRYILNDLNLALDAIKRGKASVSAKNYASEGMIYGLLARFWLEIGTRFERYDGSNGRHNDLQEQIDHDNDQWEDLGEGYQDLPPLGVTSAANAFAKAAEAARAAITSDTYSVLDEAGWHSKSSGFNSINNSWIWAIKMSPNDYFVTEGDWLSWTSFMSPEADWGLAGDKTYHSQFMIDAGLYESIPSTDWRKRTWIDPADFPDEWKNLSVAEQTELENTFNSKYASGTSLSFDKWKELYPHVGLKFRPGSGNTTSSTSGNLADIPLMRVEEMYLIEAEAKYKSLGEQAGKDALEAFVRTRDPLYNYSDATAVDDVSDSPWAVKTVDLDKRVFEKEIVRQKCIEFWGEGITLYDYKRLELPINRIYEDSNHESSAQFKSYDGYVAPWTILFIPSAEKDQNSALVLNPDPTDASKNLR